MRDYQKYAAILAVFAATLFLALIVAGFGLISLWSDREVISEPDAGPLLGPIMVGAAVLVEFALLLWLGIRTRPENQRIELGFAVWAGVAAALGFTAVGAVLYSVGEGQAAPAIAFSTAMLLGPFPLATGILGFSVALTYSWLHAAHVGEQGRPLWPWERRGE